MRISTSSVPLALPDAILTNPLTTKYPVCFFNVSRNFLTKKSNSVKSLWIIMISFLQHILLLNSA
jgi:hypothetical protein